MLLSRIRQLCEESDISITQLERACGLANATIRRWAESSPTAENIMKVADFFNTSVDYLLGRDIYTLSAEAQAYARLFDSLSAEKKSLAMAYMGVVKAQ